MQMLNKTCYISESGKVYSFGANGEGQCGLGDTDTSVTSPQLVEALNNLDIKMLSAGTDHAAALTGLYYVFFFLWLFKPSDPPYHLLRSLHL